MKLINTYFLRPRPRVQKRLDLELKLELMFPDDWELVLKTTDRFERSVGRGEEQVRALIIQLWVQGYCHLEELCALFDLCPAAFRYIRPVDARGFKASFILPILAEALP